MLSTTADHTQCPSPALTSVCVPCRSLLSASSSAGSKRQRDGSWCSTAGKGGSNSSKGAACRPSGPLERPTVGQVQGVWVFDKSGSLVGQGNRPCTATPDVATRQHSHERAASSSTSYQQQQAYNALKAHKLHAAPSWCVLTAAGNMTTGHVCCAQHHRPSAAQESNGKCV